MNNNYKFDMFFGGVFLIINLYLGEVILSLGGFPLFPIMGSLSSVTLLAVGAKEYLK